ncbi:MAG: hypothetical protein ACI9F2_000175 [Lysobacterales bacterium]|jgi:hypothetical protein
MLIVSISFAVIKEMVMNELLGKTTTDIKRSIKDLFQPKDTYHTVDVDIITEIVLGFVLGDDVENNVNDDNRYECYYQLLGKAVAIVQGWKDNCVTSITLPSQTEKSLTEYIENTYGVKI